MIRTIEQFDKQVAKCTKALDAKLKGTDGKRHIVLCGGTGCLSSHSKEIMEKFQEVLKKHGAEDMATVNLVGCFGFCSQGPFVKIYPEDTLYRLVKIDDVEEIVKTDILGGSVVERLLYVEPGTTKKVKRQDDINFYKKQRRVALTGCGVINPENVEEAMGMGAFQGMKRALSMRPQEVIDEVLAAGLRGRGGGGFPSGRKWQFAKNVEGDQKYVICNGDEGDPGAFMDRSILEGNPLAVIEGMVIAGYAIGAHDGYFYVRAEYPIAVKRLRIAIEQAKKHCLLGKNILGSEFEFNCHIRLGAGAFVCGEETALINSIEGKRGMPRPRPPFPAVKGLWQKPSIVNNVETLACVPYILREGAAAFASVGTEKSKGTKVFALGGKVNNVGLVEVPMGTTLRELIYDIGGGIPNGKAFKAIQTGGPSGGCLTDESCGKCSPCRIGTKRILEILTRITEGKGEMSDLDELMELADILKNNSLCALGQTASNPVISTLTHFRDEYIAHIVDKKCPAHICKKLMQYYIDPEKCIGCGMCARNCPASCITATDYTAPGHKRPSMAIDPKACVKCGACMSTCKFQAIEKR